MSSVTTIRISKETRERLALLGSKKDTYDNIIQKILETKPFRSGFIPAANEECHV